MCTWQASQHNLFCTASDCSTKSTVLGGLLCTQRTTFTQISIFSRHFLSRSLFSLGPAVGRTDCTQGERIWSGLGRQKVERCLLVIFHILLAKTKRGSTDRFQIFQSPLQFYIDKLDLDAGKAKNTPINIVCRSYFGKLFLM